MDAVADIHDFMSNDIRNFAARAVGQLGQRLMQFIRARVANDADSEDILQDVWQQFVTTLEDGPIERVGAWLYTVARNRIIDQYRKPPVASLEALAAELGLDDEAFELPKSLLQDPTTPESGDLRNLFWEQSHTTLAELAGGTASGVRLART